MTQFFQNKKVLVAGGTGLVGSNLIIQLLKKGAKVRATIHKKPPQIINKRIDYVRVNLLQKIGCQKAVKGMDYVFMCAANTSGAAVMTATPLVHVTPNIIMNNLMLEAAYQAGIKKFLFISSNTVYPASDKPMKETDMQYGNLFEKYYFVGWMKQFSEVLCEMYTKIKNPMKIVVVRPANTYGPFDDFEWETSHVLPALMRKVMERHNQIEVWGDGNDIKDFIYIDDLVEGILRAMEYMETYEPINLASGKKTTVREALNIMLKADGCQNAKVIFNANKPSMIPKRLINPTKAKRLLNFKARTPLEEGIKKTMQWYKQHKNI